VLLATGLFVLLMGVFLFAVMLQIAAVATFLFGLPLLVLGGFLGYTGWLGRRVLLKL
jgi:hypothetical protein